MDGVRNENLEKLTFPDNSFDMVIFSDIFEHIRKPFVAFSEVNRILKLGGAHIFTVPMLLPLPSKTRIRVDSSEEKDKFIHEPHYHGDGKGGRSLVYSDFGKDMLDDISSYTGASTEVFRFSPESSLATNSLNRIVLFFARK